MPEPAAVSTEAKIRLRPRLTPPTPTTEASPQDLATPPAPVPPLFIDPPAAPAVAESPPPPAARPRLRPRTTTEPAAATIESVAPAVLASPTPSVPSPEVTSPLPAQAAAAPAAPKLLADDSGPAAAGPSGDPSRLKLKSAPGAIDPGMLVGGLPVRPSPPSAPAPAIPVPPIPAPARPAAHSSLPPFPVLASSGTGRTNPPIPHLVAKTVTGVPFPPSVEKRPTKRRKALPFVLVGLVVVGFVAAGVLGWPYVQRMSWLNALASETVTPTESKAEAVPEQGPTTVPALNQLASMPAAAIQKAKDAIAARRDSEQSRVDAVPDGNEAPDRRLPLAPVSPASSAAEATSAPSLDAAVVTKSLAPGLIATSRIQAVADASPAFRDYVANAKISGVAPGRAIINGRLVRAGEVADGALGVTFESYDGATKQLVFRDRSGAMVVRRY